jgi:hypothetical protein
MSYLSNNRRGYSRNMPKPTRCDYCKAPATVWAKYRGFLASTGRPGSGGRPLLYVASCAAHEGCENWKGMLAFHPDAEVCRA